MPPKVHHPHPKWTTPKPLSDIPVRPILSSDDIKKLTEKMRTQFNWDQDPKDFQLEGTRAQIEGMDMIIQAPTGSGKTAIAAGPHVWPSSKGKISIVISPLLALEEEMVHTFKTDFGLNAIAVHNKNGGCSRSVVQKLLSREYQILLVSPEMIQSRVFVNRVLRNSKFSNRVLSMVVDEAHCISHWGSDFRKKYGTLGIVRAFLPRKTPVIAMTATLTRQVRRDIHSKLQFSKGFSRFINIGNDRPNVSMVVRACEHPQNTYLDLDFVIPTELTSLADIPKTWIYVDNIATGNEILDHLRNVIFMQDSRLVESEDFSDVVRPFNAVMSMEYRREAMEAFRKGKIRVMICTDAAGMGCDIPDVEVVVQWMLPKTFSNWIQRAGRAARGKHRKGLAILIAPRSVYKLVLTGNAQTAGGTQSKAKGGGRKLNTQSVSPAEANEYAKAHGVARGGTKKLDERPTACQPPMNMESPDEGLTAFVQSTVCRREVWAQAFDTIVDRSALSVPCCDICDPSLFDRTRPAACTKPKRNMGLPTRGEPVKDVEKKLREWRRSIYMRDHRRAMYEPNAILSDDTISMLSSHGSITSTMLSQLLSKSWIWWKRYGEELDTFMQTRIGEIPYIPKQSESKASAGGTAKERTDRAVLAAQSTSTSLTPCGPLTPSKRPASPAESDTGATSQSAFNPTNIQFVNGIAKRSRTSTSNRNGEFVFKMVTFPLNPPAPLSTSDSVSPPNHPFVHATGPPMSPQASAQASRPSFGTHFSPRTESIVQQAAASVREPAYSMPPSQATSTWPGYRTPVDTPHHAPLPSPYPALNANNYTHYSYAAPPIHRTPPMTPPNSQWRVAAPGPSRSIPSSYTFSPATFTTPTPAFLPPRSQRNIDIPLQQPTIFKYENPKEPRGAGGGFD